MASDELTIYCHCAHYDLVDEKVKSRVLASIRACEGPSVAVADLCGLCAEKDPILKEWASAGRVRIFACHRRAVKWLFEAGDAPLPDNGVEFFNMRTTPVEQLQAAVGADAGESDVEAGQLEKGDWVPWFPTIDYDRCINCKQCLNFCLFGVYELDEDDRVRVARPANCKTNCPACARVCPRAAIIFAKHPESPINGDEVDEQALHQHKEKARLEILMKGNIRERLRNRSPKKRFASEPKGRSESPFEHLQREFGIPAGVLESLSAEDVAAIKDKAATVKPTDRPRRAADE